MTAEHRKNKRPSARGKHEKGMSRKRRDHKNKVYAMDALLKRAKTLALYKRYAEAFELLKLADANNDYMASYAIGTWYLHGRHVQKNLKKGFSYLTKAAKGNIADAYFD